MSAFKTRRIPRELLLDPPPRKTRWKIWLCVLTVAMAAVLSVHAVRGTPPEQARTANVEFRKEAAP